MSGFEWAKAGMLPADWDDFSNFDRQARELWERVERERETEPIMTWEEWSELHPSHLPDHDTLIIIDELHAA